MPVTIESRLAVHELRRITGKMYPKLEASFEKLGVEELRDLVRLCRDLDASIRSAERKAMLQPHRRL